MHTVHEISTSIRTAKLMGRVRQGWVTPRRPTDATPDQRPRRGGNRITRTQFTPTATGHNHSLEWAQANEITGAGDQTAAVAVASDALLFVDGGRVYELVSELNAMLTHAERERTGALQALNHMRAELARKGRGRRTGSGWSGQAAHQATGHGHMPTDPEEMFRARGGRLPDDGMGDRDEEEDDEGRRAEQDENQREESGGTRRRRPHVGIDVNWFASRTSTAKDPAMVERSIRARVWDKAKPSFAYLRWALGRKSLSYMVGQGVGDSLAGRGHGADPDRKLVIPAEFFEALFDERGSTTDAARRQILGVIRAELERRTRTADRVQRAALRKREAHASFDGFFTVRVE